MDLGFAIFFALVALYAAVAALLSRRSVTMPLIFVAVGAVFGFLLKLIPFETADAPGVETLTKITLALLLFADASTLDIGAIRKDGLLPGRLLAIGLPLTLLLGGLVAYAFFPEHGIGFGLLIGAILAPTDAALGLPVFKNTRVPVRIRRALNVESGLNDGIATPFVTLFVALALAQMSDSLTNWISLALIEIVLAVIAGALIGLVGGFISAVAAKRGWSSQTSVQIGNLALALCAYFGSLAIGGNGFIAAFVGGLCFGYAAREHGRESAEFTETVGTLLSLAVWTVFGASIVVPLLAVFNPLAFLYAVLSLTVIRMVPVAIALIGMRLRIDTVLMMGWLGPRGLASVVFALVAYQAFLQNGQAPWLLMETAGWTVLLSVTLHGLSAVPLANWYARRLAHAPSNAPELEPVEDVRIRRRILAPTGNETRVTKAM